MSPSSFKSPASASGFTLVEVIAATFVLAIGLLAAAATGKVTKGRQPKDMTLASRLASQKLDELARWDPSDPNVCVPAGSSSVGSVTADVTQTTACPGGASDIVSYFDDVTMGATDGTFSETISGVSEGNPIYVTTTHSADGSISISTSDSPPSKPPTFHRRWIIDRTSRAAGARRVTVLVTLLDKKVQPPVTFQMSTAYEAVGTGSGRSR